MGTPLNAIEVRASMIANGEVVGDASKQSALAVIQSCERMTRTIGQLLAFARPQALECAPVDLARLVRQTVTLVTPLATKSAVEIEVAVPSGEIARVDELQIQQAVTNLVMNAVQAMPAGGHVRVMVDRLEAVDDAPPGSGGPFIRIRIEDDGPGISPEHLPHIFDPFFTTKEVGRGTGLGLSITRNIIHDHRGWIALSRAAGGATFDVFLPAETTA
jgi:signal transduction histidine kinase